MAHTIIITAYRTLGNGIHYQDLGATYFDERHRQAVVRRSLRRLEGLGYRFTLEAA